MIVLIILIVDPESKQIMVCFVVTISKYTAVSLANRTDVRSYCDEITFTPLVLMHFKFKL